MVINMRLRDIMDSKKLQEIQDMFSDSTGLAAIAVDSDGEYVTQGSNFTDFCMKYTRGNPEGLRRCVKCDNECTGTYYCHAGLMDFASPIIVEGERVGSIIGGQVLPNEPVEEQFRAIARDLGINEDEYIKALKKVPIRSEKMIRASAKLLGDVVNELVNLEYLKKLNSKKIDVFNRENIRASDAIDEVESRMRDLNRIATMEKILAINASIEAGRAGQAGVGFSVVAKEMGELSGQSASVYKEIQELVATIEDSVKNMNRVKL